MVPPARRLFAISVLAFFLLWHLGAVVFDQPLVLPSPLAVAAFLAQTARTGLFWAHFASSLARVLLSIGLTVTLGGLLGVLSGGVPAFRAIIAFPLGIVRAIPVAAIVVLAIFWFGPSVLPVFVASLMGLPVMIDSVAAGIRAVPRRLLDACRVYGFTKKQLFFHFYLPAVHPAFRAAVGTVFGLAWKVTVTGETLVLPRFGAGSLLYTAKVHLETAEVFAIAVMMAAVCIAMEGLLHLKIRTRGRGKRLVPPASKKTSPAAEVLETAEVCPSALCVEHLSLSRGGKELFRDFSITFAGGKVTALMAASGAGKTTLLDTIAGLIPSSSRFPPASYLFQDPQLLPWRTILENVAIPIGGDIAAAEDYLAQVGLGDKLDRYPSELSGGEAQRAALARAAAYSAAASGKGASVFLLDEAFRSQDLPLKLSLMELTRGLLAELPRTVVVVTHDVREALTLADRVVVLSGSPLTVTLDETVVKPAMPNMREMYARMSPALLALEEKIISALGEDHS